MTGNKSGRWVIALAGVLLQVALGTVYAWSFFQKPIMEANNWNNSEVAWAFSLAIFFLGVAASWGGMKLPAIGPRKLAMLGGLLYSVGHLIASWALHQQSLVLLYIGYGVIGGLGLGLGYVTPVATAAKWFPDKKGQITGMVVMGFGFGALVMSKIIAPCLMQWTGGNLVQVFLAIGLIMGVITLPAGYFLVNPPAGFQPAGYTAAPVPAAQAAAANTDGVLSHILSRRFIIMWAIFFLNICAGIMLIGFQSPLFQDLLRQGYPLDQQNTPETVAILASAGATLIAISSICNGLGRFFWGSMSDKIGRLPVFRIILGTQVLVFVTLIFSSSPILFSALICYILLCYGGGFGTMPSFVLDEFGAAKMGVVYGCILTAWSIAGICGPQIVAFLKDNFAENAATYTFAFASVLLVAGFLLTFFFPKKTVSLSQEAAAGAKS